MTNGILWGYLQGKHSYSKGLSKGFLIRMLWGFVMWILFTRSSRGQESQTGRAVPTCAIFLSFCYLNFILVHILWFLPDHTQMDTFSYIPCYIINTLTL